MSEKPSEKPKEMSKPALIFGICVAAGIGMIFIAMGMRELGSAFREYMQYVWGAGAFAGIMFIIFGPKEPKEDKR